MKRPRPDSGRVSNAGGGTLRRIEPGSPVAQLYPDVAAPGLDPQIDAADLFPDLLLPDLTFRCLPTGARRSAYPWSTMLLNASPTADTTCI